MRALVDAQTAHWYSRTAAAFAKWTENIRCGRRAIRDTPHGGLTNPDKPRPSDRSRHASVESLSPPAMEGISTMGRTHWGVRACTLTGGLLALALGGCSDSMTPTSPTSIPAAEASDIGAAEG